MSQKSRTGCPQPVQPRSAPTQSAGGAPPAVGSHISFVKQKIIMLASPDKSAAELRSATSSSEQGETRRSPSFSAAPQRICRETLATAATRRRAGEFLNKGGRSGRLYSKRGLALQRVEASSPTCRKIMKISLCILICTTSFIIIKKEMKSRYAIWH